MLTESERLGLNVLVVNRLDRLLLEILQLGMLVAQGKMIVLVENLNQSNSYFLESGKIQYLCIKTKKETNHIV